MRRKLTQIVLALVGVLYLAMTYPLVTDLRHAKWLVVMNNETEPMFLAFYIALGFFLVLAARNPVEHRSLIVFAAWQSIAHASVMAILTIQAWQHGNHRDFTDVVVVTVIGAVLMVAVPAARGSPALSLTSPTLPSPPPSVRTSASP
jgi:peptidoglycan/LPS O-acetylase OafA/YrhL